MLSPALKTTSRPDLAEDLYGRFIDDMTANAEQKALEKLKPELEAANARTEAALAKLESVNVSRETLQKELTAALSQVDDLKKTIESMKTQGPSEVSVLSEQSVNYHKELKTKFQELEKKISSIPQPKPETKVIQSAPISIPSFNVEPVRDAAGNIISAKVIPIGGN